MCSFCHSVLPAHVIYNERTQYIISLSSNASSLSTFRDNKTTSYCVRLPQIIDLNDDWKLICTPSLNFTLCILYKMTDEFITLTKPDRFW